MILGPGKILIFRPLQTDYGVAQWFYVGGRCKDVWRFMWLWDKDGHSSSFNLYRVCFFTRLLWLVRARLSASYLSFTTRLQIGRRQRATWTSDYSHKSTWRHINATAMQTNPLPRLLTPDAETSRDVRVQNRHYVPFSDAISAALVT
jgi:hypothetical protein